MNVDLKLNFLISKRGRRKEKSDWVSFLILSILSELSNREGNSGGKVCLVIFCV